MRETKEEVDDDDDGQHHLGDDSQDSYTSAFFDAQRRYMTPIQRRLNWFLLLVVIITYSVSFLVFAYGLIVWLHAVLPPYVVAAAYTLGRRVFLEPFLRFVTLSDGGAAGLSSSLQGTGVTQESGAVGGANSTMEVGGESSRGADRLVEWLLFSGGR